jgi:CheY-like chemotaxis protein
MSAAMLEFFALARAARRGLHALIVDDHPVNRQVLSLMLQRVPARVTCAENGAEGLKAFKAERFDLVLMDLRMPVMDGYEAMRRIRADEAARKLPRTPIIVASAHTTPFDILRARDAGADEHIGKPIHIPTLFGAMEAVLRGSGESAARTAG